MADIAVYLDGSGLAGTVGSASLWADVVNWQRGLDTDEYPQLVHLLDNGWGQNLDGLQAELESALSSSPPHSDALEDGLHQLLDLVGSRTDGDSAIAVAIAEGDEEGQVGNEMSHRDVDQAINQMLAEKYTKSGAGAGGNDLSPRQADCWPVDVYDDYFVYRMTPPSGASKFYRQDYSVDENDQVSFDGEPEEVVRVTDYVPVKNDEGEDVVNEDEEEVGNWSGEVTVNGKRLPSGRLGISPAKACQILKDGEVRGKPLSQAQRGLFGVICGRRRKKSATENTENVDGEEHECGCVGTCQCVDGEEMDASQTALVVREALAPAGNSVGIANSVRNSVREALANGADARGVFASLRVSIGSEQVRNAIKEMTVNAGGGNPYHDPSTGQFTSGGGGAGGSKV